VKRPEGYTVAEVVQILGLSRQRVHALVKAGRLKVKGIERIPGRGRLILDRASVSRELRRRKTR
jgi:predicted site-specific integrase-resolvase